MAQDQERKTIKCFRNRLKQLIQVAPVLDALDFMNNDQKDLIRATLRNEGNLKAADLLLREILHTTFQPGWFGTFIMALEVSGCKQAANYMGKNLPSPSKEAENDSYIKLIDLLKLSLVNMKTNDVCDQCYQQNILTQEDCENIKAEVGQHGSIAGARTLLSRLVKNELGWFSQFLTALEETGHGLLVEELLGGPAEPDDQVDKPQELKDKSELVTQVEEMAGAEENPSFYSFINSSAEFNTLETDLDLYSDSMEALEEPETVKAVSLDQSVSEQDIVLRDYQTEVAHPALEGKNVIICLPTGSGKTRVAVYITKQHLDSRNHMKRPAKVVVLVNKVPLVEQHYKAEFGKFLNSQYKVERVSGDSQLKISFPKVVEENDIIICTAQILENSLAKARQGDEEGIELSQFTLMVIDECHHTKKGEVYNHIMTRYLKQKHRNTTLQKEHKDPVLLPQILGLTASPGVGGAKNQAKAEEHILQICANLDAYTIMTKKEGEEQKRPYKRIASAPERKEDPFGDVIKCIMNDIHEHARLNPLFQPGSQKYEQWVVQTEQIAAKEENQRVRVCAEHLRQYNEALHQSNTIRMSDAFRFLDKFYNEEMKKKMNPDSDEPIQITDTERFLFHLFKDKKQRLQQLMNMSQYENNLLGQLRTLILKEFTSRVSARGIIFTRTRLSAIALSQWIQENPKFEEAGVKASYLIGGGDQSVIKPMTGAEQREVLTKFRVGTINLLVATSVAEEGLDIAACNVVLRYGLVTNEIAMIQARGRGRAEDSSYTVVAEAGSGVAERESVNEYREKMMSKAIARVCTLSREEYECKIKENQLQAIMEERVKAKKKQQKRMIKEDPNKVKLNCRSCNIFVCSGEDIEVIERMHHVNVNRPFRELFIVKENTSLQERSLDYEVNGIMACKKCGQNWGNMMLYKSIECPCLHVKNFVVTYESEKKKTYSKWSELLIQFRAFDYSFHAMRLTEMSDEEMDTTE